MKEVGRSVGPAVLDAVEVGIITTNENGEVRLMNRFASTLLRRRSEGGPINVVELLELGATLEELLAGDDRRTLSWAYVGPESELDLEITLARASAYDPADAGFFVVFRDVREEKLAAAERSRFERLAAMGTMVAGFAHEVRNPVAAMRSITEQLAEELRDVRSTVPHVGLLLRMIERIERLVKTALQFGRPAAPRRALQHPHAIVSAALTETQARTRNDQAIRVELDVDLPEIYVDERQIAQALVILLNNALDATGSGSRVLVRVRRVRGTDSEPRMRKSEPPVWPAVRFEVVDDGGGISPDLMGRIFDPFFTTKPTGTGLGLSIAQQIVSENGARLEVVSSPADRRSTEVHNGTTTFAIVVPTENDTAALPRFP